MAKTNGRTAQPKKSAPKARPLSADELLALCGGNKSIAAELLDMGFRQHRRGEMDFSKQILKAFLKDEKTINGMSAKKALGQIDENKATRILRRVAKENGRTPRPASTARRLTRGDHEKGNKEGRRAGA